MGGENPGRADNVVRVRYFSTQENIIATLTITTTAPQDARIVVAFGKYLGLGRNATAAEVKAEVIAFIRLTVAAQEKEAAVKTATNTAVAGLTDLGQPT